MNVKHLVIAALHDVLLEANWVLDVDIVLHLLGRQPLQFCVEFCHTVLHRERNQPQVMMWRLEYLGE